MGHDMSRSQRSAGTDIACGLHFWGIILVANLCCLLCILLTLQTSPEDSFVSADALLNRISKKTSLCDQSEYLEPDLAEKNPPVFAQKLQVCSRSINVTFL